jgi:hypothetical protein
LRARRWSQERRQCARSALVKIFSAGVFASDGGSGEELSRQAVLQKQEEEQDGHECLVSLLHLDGDSKELSDESRLAEAFSFVHPLHLSFSDHV